jgi:chromosome segregation ATPase
MSEKLSGEGMAERDVESADEIVRVSEGAVERLMYEWQYSKASSFDPVTFIAGLLAEQRRKGREQSMARELLDLRAERQRLVDLVGAWNGTPDGPREYLEDLLGEWSALTDEVTSLRAEVERLQASVECEKNAGRDWMAWCGEAKQEATARTAEVAALTRALGERETKVERLREALSFFRSVIKSGEPWTDECEDAYRAALTEEGSDG